MKFIVYHGQIRTVGLNERGNRRSALVRMNGARRDRIYTAFTDRIRVLRAYDWQNYPLFSD